MPEDTSPEVLQAAEAAYKETRTKIENLGAVNPSAWEEFQEAQQRHDFLTAQRQDLLDSIRDTEKAIQEIDEFSKNRFSEAFKAINENFKQAFQTLFGGGSGEMHLTDEIEHQRQRHRYHRLAPGQETAERAAAFRR